MATIRAVPIPYATPQAAHDAADAGDVILLAPGAHGAVICTKAVHIKGDSTDPSAVSMVSPDANTMAIVYSLPSNTQGDVWLEGLTLSGGASGLVLGVTWPVGAVWRVNRVIVANATHYLGYFVSGGRVQARIEQLTARGAYGGAILYVSNRTDHRIELLRADLTLAPEWPGGGTPANWALYSADWVTTPAADYGAGYGDWLAPPAVSYALGGTVENLRPGDSPGDFQALIYRERAAGGMEPNAWVQITPDSLSGVWLAQRLPVTHRYYRAVVGPGGYPPELDGPYDPAAVP